MTYKEILDKKSANILITGDSLSYNRYGYDDKHRENAYNCGVGMSSWSFSLRDLIYKSDPQFLFGEDISFNCKTIVGIDNNPEVPNTAMFGGKIKTLFPEENVLFTVPIKNDEIVLYLQKRIDHPCRFDVFVDNKLAAKDVNTHGNTEDFAGYGLMLLRLPCDSDIGYHTVEFKNICGDSPKITVAAIGGEYKNIILNGKGGEPVNFFVDNFKERIARYNPDLIILSLGGNDRIMTSPENLRINLIKLFSMIFDKSPSCKVLYLLPPSSHYPSDPDRDVSPYSSIITAETYNRTIERVCRRLGKEDGYDGFGTNNYSVYDIDTMRISDLFDNDAVLQWRYDNIHLNPYGNEVLLKAVADRLGIMNTI